MAGSALASGDAAGQWPEIAGTDRIHGDLVMQSAPFVVSHLDHVVLRTRQLERLVAFYTDLGLTVERDRVAQMGMMQLRMGRSMLDIVAVAAESGTAAPVEKNLDHFAVRIEPFDEQAIAAFCEDRQIPYHIMPGPILGADGMGRAIYIEDPDGNRMELKGPPLAS